MNEETKKQFLSLKETLKTEFEKIKTDFGDDLVIDEHDLDVSLLNIPITQTKWSSRLSNEILNLKDLYALKEQTKLERWKYYSGKQSDKYVSENGIMHEKILKSDLDKYLSCDVKLNLVNDLVSIQKEKVDFIERGLKELTNRGFHIKSIIDWRRFISGQ